jgi:hypothetical protein
MKCRLGLFGILCFSLGCAADAQNGSWSEVMKDLRGDNMQLKGFSASNGSPNRPTPASAAKPPAPTTAPAETAETPGDPQVP